MPESSAQLIREGLERDVANGLEMRAFATGGPELTIHLVSEDSQGEKGRR